MKSDRTAFKKSLRVQLSDYKIRDGSRFIEWGLAGEGVWGMEMAQPLVGR